MRLAPTLACQQAHMWKGDVRGLHMGLAELGIGRSSGSSIRTRFRLGDYQVGPKVGLGVFVAFLACFYGERGPWTCVLAPNWRKLCYFGSMRCHSHVGACVNLS
jgi:hypothetical protein